MTYEYVCGACGHQWEAEQPISAEPLKDCPACGKAQAKRQISLGGGFILKGGGWYADLYGSSNKSPGKDAGASSESKNGSSSSDSKPSASDSKSSASDSSSSSSSTSTPSKASDSSAA